MGNAGLAVTVLTGLAIVMGGVVFALRMLWNIRGGWDATNAELRRLVDKVTDLIASKDRDHERLERRADELAQRLERHLEWHDKH